MSQPVQAVRISQRDGPSPPTSPRWGEGSRRLWDVNTDRQPPEGVATVVAAPSFPLW